MLHFLKDENFRSSVSYLLMPCAGAPQWAGLQVSWHVMAASPLSSLSLHRLAQLVSLILLGYIVQVF